MKFHIIAMPLVAAACLVTNTGKAQSLNQSQLSPGKRNASGPFLSHVPGKTTVEIIRSVEVKLAGPNESNVRMPSSDTRDLLFSDLESKKWVKEISRHRGATKGERKRPDLSDIISLTPSETKNEYPESNGISPPKSLAADSLDFNTRILIGNVLIRNCNNKTQDDKYSYFSDPKVSDNTHHATYINRNSSTAFSKSRTNVKFPPKMLPLKNVNAQQNRPNKTSITGDKFSLYRQRIGKKFKIKQNNIEILSSESYNKLKPSEVTPATNSHTQNKVEHLQALTHWDFGKKTPHAESNDESNIPISGLTAKPATKKNEHFTAPILPHVMHPTKGILHPKEEPTRKSASENALKRPGGPQVTIQNAFPRHEYVPIYDHINSIQTLPFLSNLNNVNSPQNDHVMHAHNRNVIRTNHGPHLFPNTHVQDENKQIRSGNAEDANTRTYSSETRVQNYIPVANAGQQSEQQHGDRNNWQHVYFFPHVALQQQQQPAVVNLQTVDTAGPANAIPLVLQQQNSHLYQPALVATNQAFRTPNGFVYEGTFFSNTLVLEARRGSGL